MNKKMLYVATFVFACALALVATGVSAQSNGAENKSRGDQHKSDVADVVKELVKIGDRDDQIGEEVKTVAKEEKTESEVVKEKMDKVESRSAFKTFLIGSDYKNLGALRSELVTAQNRLNRLNNSLEKTTSTTIQADLKVQIAELETIKAKAEAFVKTFDGKFSLFGWLAKLFN